MTPTPATLALLLLAAPALAAVAPADRCAASKLRSLAARERQLLSCHAKAAGRGGAADPSCAADVAATLLRDFSRAEAAGGCAVAGDGPTLRTDLEASVTQGAGALRPVATRSACAARKLKAAGQYARAALRAFAADTLAPEAARLDAALAAAAQQLDGRFARLDAGADCLTVADAAAVAALVLSGSTLQPPPAPGGIRLLVARLRPSCGNGLVDQPDESCDGTDDAACDGLCQPGCTCPAPVCGNGVLESGEACEGDTCFLPGYGLAGCSGGGAGGCRCCDGGICGILGCCRAGDVCVYGPSGFGSCFQTRCGPSDPCQPGYTCVEIGEPPGGWCLAGVGSVCRPGHPQLPFIPCVAPAVCPAPVGSRCCLPAGAACGTDGGCCAGTTCTGGVCS